MAGSVADRAELVLAFTNTHDHFDRLPDRFRSVSTLTEWLGAELGNAVDPTVAITPADVVEAREIRDALIDILLPHADASASNEEDLVVAERVLRRAALRYPLQAEITRAGGQLTCPQPGLAGVLGSVLAAVVELSQSGEWRRLKACRNCRHAFLDQSRNRSAGYCRSQCSSQAGMRAYRSRQREKSARD